MQTKPSAVKSGAKKSAARANEPSDWQSQMRCMSLEQAADEAWGRILLMGPAKGGKTVCTALTAPPPVLILNCDRPGAASGAKTLARQFGRDPDKDIGIIEVRSPDDWLDATERARRGAEKGLFRTLIVDTITFLVDMLVRDIVHNWEGKDARQAWGEVGKVCGQGFERLFDLEAHLIVNAHAAPDDSGLPGVLPAVQGQMKRWVPGTIHDWICLDVSTEHEKGANGKVQRNVHRTFLVGPQGYWHHGSRHSRRAESFAIDADITALLGELGIKP